MSETLYIWLGETPDSPWHWAGPDGATGLAESDEQKAILGDIDARTIAAIIPGQAVRILAHELPDMAAKDRLQAAQFAAEETTGAPLKSQHIVMGGPEDAQLAIITKAKMREVIESLEGFGISPDMVLADYDVLGGAIGAVRFEDRIINSGADGYTVDSDWDVDGEFRQAPVMNFTEIATLFDTSGAVNLRQGQFVKSKSWQLGGWLTRGQMMVAAALLGVFGVTSLAMMAAQARALNQQAAAWNLEAAKIFTDATGQNAPANPAAALTRMTSGGVISANVLPLAGRLVEAVSQVEGVMIESLQYDAARAQLSLRLIYPSFESTAQLEKAAAETGAVFSAGGVREQNGQLIGEASFALGAGA